jgi:CubicO group peptidase (beta-lactamase class C family)
MAGYVAEQAAGKRYGTLMEEMVLRPTGMERSTFRPLTAMTMPFAQGHLGPAGQPPRVVRPFTENTAQWAAGFLFSNAGEVARFAMLLMQGGTAAGRVVLAPGAVRRMTTGHVGIPGLEATGSRYGYGLMVGRRDTLTTWQHGGAINGFQAQVVMVPSQGFAVVVLTNRGGSSLPEVVEHAALLVLGTTQPRPAVDSARAATAAERLALVGRYAHGAIQVEIVQRDGALFLRQGGGELPIRVRGSDRIEIQPPGAPPTVVVMVPGPDGRIAYLHQGMRAIPRQP